MALDVQCSTIITGGDSLAPTVADLFAAEGAKRTRLSHEEVCELVERISQGDKEAKALLIEANLRLLSFVAKRYQGHGLPVRDLVQEGVFGLARAAELFDPTQGAFSTYAVPWIAQAIRRAIDNTSRTIRLPGYVHEQMRALACAQDSLLSEQGREPTAQELAGVLGLSVTRVRLLLAHQHRLLSLDAPVNGHPDLHLSEIIADQRTTTLDAALIEYTHAHERVARIQAALCCLTPRERRVVALLFGLDGQSGTHDGAAIGRILGLSRERVRQLKVRAFAKLQGRAELMALVN
jgi:RNA polymerase primary sigma factor